ncbi:uncharacterized protein LOC130664835 [Microplitis mediator]|uniref:uncharacterized protein LOC130664835 n=1 Tax=Microplitis mediator TaxID=375433 RepID=UPI002556FCCC|nr:uncharacterized protein LOC130664835 [Microplitis mediator]
MWMRQMIWWLLLVFSYDKIMAFDKLLYKPPPTHYTYMGQLLKLCYAERSNPVVITKNLIDIIDEVSVDNIEFPVMAIDTNFKSKDIQIFNPSYPLYILSTDSIDQLQTLLNELKSTPTWSIISIFFIVGSIESNCRNASEVLQLLWTMELLSSFYVCIEPNNDKMIYTYNPYTNRAPEPWENVDLIDKPNDRWTLYKQLYSQNDKKFCQSLSFDKTKVLDGYEVKAVGEAISWTNISRNETYNTSSFDNTLLNIEKMFYKTLFSKLNVTPIISYDDEGFYENGSASGFVKSLINGTHDVGLGLRLTSDEAYKVIDIINLYYQNGFMIITQQRPFTIPTEEVADFKDLHFAIILSIIVFSLTFIMIALNNGFQYFEAALNVFRMILGAAIRTPLRSLSMRICFLTATLLVFMINPAIQGRLSSLLATPERRNPENFEDLYEHKYHLYHHPVVEQDILSEQLWSNSSDRYHLHPILSALFGCSEYVLNDTSAACLAYSEFQVSSALKYNLHISQKLQLKNYFSFWARKNWALKARVDQIASRMNEAGLFDHWDRATLQWPLKKLKASESVDTSMQYTQIELENMLFIYIFMSLSLVFILITFGFELLFNKLAPRKLKLRQKVVIFNRRVHVLNEWV